MSSEGRAATESKAGELSLFGIATDLRPRNDSYPRWGKFTGLKISLPGVFSITEFKTFCTLCIMCLLLKALNLYRSPAWLSSK